ncbi:armadillo repeat-containing protein 7 [Planococcus citri]|uniref:armadillo repeat-containing protein 7 n=1 Tax=Planococcus citri TaxID=170843 RepID=UPI0031F96F65
MFSRPERLRMRTPKDGVGRYDYLKQLITEFGTTKSHQNKLQVIANLANFAYDPINYKFLTSLRVIDLFLDQLSESDPALVQYAIGGICNIVIDPVQQEYLIRSKGINSVVNCLHSEDEQTVLSAITILISTLASGSNFDYINEGVLNHMKQLSTSSNIRFQNLAKIFLQDFNVRLGSDQSTSK